MLGMPTVNTKLEQLSWELAGEFEDALEERRHLRFSKGTKKKTRKYEYLLPNSNPHIETEEHETAKQLNLISKFPLSWRKYFGEYAAGAVEKVNSQISGRPRIKL